MEVTKIMIQSPLLVVDCVENMVTHIFEAQYDVLEFIAVFAGRIAKYQYPQEYPKVVYQIFTCAGA